MKKLDHPSRRDILQGGVALPWIANSISEAYAQDKPGEYPSMILRETNPVNLEFPFETLADPIVPNERFFTRSHFPEPEIQLDKWRLKVEGAVDHPLELSFQDLLKMQSVTKPLLIECAGNGRVFLQPKVRGLQWEMGGVGVARWTGVSLLSVLGQAGPTRAAVQVILEGADVGEVRDAPNQTPGVIHFARSMPMRKAMQPDVLLAYKMNGVDLSKAHGFPLRAVVPGWYGVASIKWLTRIIVTDQPFNGFFQSLDYSYFKTRDKLSTLVPVSEVEVKAQIARPARGEVLKKDTEYRVHGAAWTGDSEIRKVEISTDGGKTWTNAKLDAESPRYSWRLWESRFTPRAAGKVTLMARATDARGHVQPTTRDPGRRTYMINHVIPIEIEVR